MSTKIVEGQLSGAGLRVAIVAGRFNAGWSTAAPSTR